MCLFAQQDGQFSIGDCAAMPSAASHLGLAGIKALQWRHDPNRAIRSSLFNLALPHHPRFNQTSIPCVQEELSIRSASEQHLLEANKKLQTQVDADDNQIQKQAKALKWIKNVMWRQADEKQWAEHIERKIPTLAMFEPEHVDYLKQRVENREPVQARNSVSRPLPFEQTLATQVCLLSAAC